MGVPSFSQALRRFADEELLRAPLLFGELLHDTVARARDSLPGMSPSQRAVVAELMQSVPAHRKRLAEYFIHSLREQVEADLERSDEQGSRSSMSQTQALSLVDEDEVALNVELSHTIELINSSAEFELRELQTYISGLVGDMDVTRDHNPFRAEVYARAVWAASQALATSRGLQAAFMHHASMPLANLLRKTYAASCTRLESMGVEPAAYRTVILPPGARRSRPGDTTFVPDLHSMRETMAAPSESMQLLGATVDSTPPLGSRLQPAAHEHWTAVARGARQADRQAIELVSRLFDAISADKRVPADIALLVSRLHGPAMRLALRDSGLLDQSEHPLWRFINRLCFAAEMSPDGADPERVQLLKVAQAAVDQLSSESDQNSGLYRWAYERLETFLNKRLTRRLGALSNQMVALQQLEDKLLDDPDAAHTLHGTLDTPHMDTVPAALLGGGEGTESPPADSEAWLNTLIPGDWVRMFLSGRWINGQLLWAGDRGEIWLFGDGASDATWAVRRAALLTMHEKGLMKALKQRNIVAGAAQRVQEIVAAEGGVP